MIICYATACEYNDRKEEPQCQKDVITITDDLVCEEYSEKRPCSNVSMAAMAETDYLLFVHLIILSLRSSFISSGQ